MEIDRLAVGELLESVAARAPVPGGGAVAALTAGLAAALGRMVVAYSGTKQEAGLAEAGDALGRLQQRALELAGADAEAFARLSELWTLPAEDEHRRAEWAGVVAGAIDAPRRVIETSRETLRVLDRLSAAASRNLRSDLAIAALLAQAAAEAAAWNVRINLPLVADDAEARRLEAETETVLAEVGALRDAVERACRH